MADGSTWNFMPLHENDKDLIECYVATSNRRGFWEIAGNIPRLELQHAEGYKFQSRASGILS